MPKSSTQYDAFQEMTAKLLSVPHSEIKAKLDEEKKMKKKRKKSKKSSASREGA